MKLGFIFLSDAAEALNGKIYALGGGWNRLTLRLGDAYGFALALGIDVPWDETESPHELQIHVEDPDGSVLGEEPFRGQFQQGRAPDSKPGQDQRAVLTLHTQLRFTASGPHAAVVKVDDNEVGRERFYVLEAPEEPEDAPPPDES